MRKLKVICASLLPLCIVACASRVSPTGGPRDEVPPEVVSSNPENNSIFFNSKKITITFNEFIDLKNGGTNILITPIPEQKPKYVVKRKSLIVEFKDTLEKDATYVLSFDNSVADITESNLTKDFRYVFSTGSYIDSLILKGNCKDAFTGQPTKDATVMLYITNNDSLPFKTTPRYFARTDENGNFTIFNIKNGSYKLFVLEDSNANFLFDNPNESIGFLPNMIDVNDSVNVISEAIRLFRNPLPNQKLIKKNFDYPGVVHLSFAKPVDSLAIRVLYPENLSPLKVNYLRNRDSIDIWFPRIDDDSLKIVLAYGDEKIKSDTVKFMIRKPNMKIGGRTSKSTSDTTLKFQHPFIGNRFSPFDSVLFKFRRPISLAESDKMILTREEDTLQLKLVFNPLDFQVYAPLVVKEDETYNLLILPNAFIDIFGQTNDTVKLQFKVMNEREFGAFEFILQSDSLHKNNLVIQLYQKNEIFESLPYAINQKIKFSKLKPGNYNIRLLVDENGNGKWDEGDYFSKRQAEEVLNYPQTINIRAGWDTENIWEYDKGMKKSEKLK